MKFKLRRSLEAFVLAGLLPNALPVGANPTGETIVAGDVEISRAGNQTDIFQQSTHAIINWTDFSIAVGETTNFVVPDASAATLNRVISSNLSEILGDLNSNGKVFLINPNGLVVGASARIDTQGFVASTLDTADADFLDDGHIAFSGNTNAAIINLGTVSASGGDLFLIATNIQNDGDLTGSGTVGLGAGRDVLITDSGNDRVNVRVGSGSLSNTGLIEAARAELKAANNNPLALAVNNGGTIRATGIAEENGRLILRASAGAVSNAGTLGGAAQVQIEGTSVSTTPSSNIGAYGDINLIAHNGAGGANGSLPGGNGGNGNDGGDVVVRGAVASSDGSVLVRAGYGGAGGFGGWVGNVANVQGGAGGNGGFGGDITVDAAISATGSVTIQAGHGGGGGLGGDAGFGRVLDPVRNWDVSAGLVGGRGGAGGWGGDLDVSGVITSGVSTTILAGNGASGARAGSAFRPGQSLPGNVGGDGGFGGELTVSANLIANGDLYLGAGHGGSGGNGGRSNNNTGSYYVIFEGNTFVTSPNGSEGGRGGYGGWGGDLTVSVDLAAAGNLTVKAGNAGSAGSGGRGGNGEWGLSVSPSNPGGVGGAGGDGGDGGFGGNLSASHLTAGSSVTVSSGFGGNGGSGMSGGNAGPYAAGGIGGRGGAGGRGGDLAVGDISSDAGGVTLVAGSGGHSGNGGTGGDGGGSGSSIQSGGVGGLGGSGNLGRSSGTLTFGDIAGDAVSITSGRAGNGGTGAVGGLTKLTNFGQVRVASGNDGSGPESRDLVLTTNITAKGGNVVLNAGRNLVMGSGVSVTAAGDGDIVAAAVDAFVDEHDAFVLDNGRFVIYASRPDTSVGELEKNPELVRYGTGFNPNDPTPGFLGDASAVVFSSIVDVDVVTSDQSISYGDEIDTQAYSVSGFRIGSDSFTLTQLGLDSTLEIDVTATAPRSTGGYIRAGNYAGALVASSASNLRFNVDAGDLEVAQHVLTATGSAAAKVYDGNTGVEASLVVPEGLAGDIVDVSLASAQFIDKEAGSDKAIDLDISVGGADSANYQVVFPTLVANIAPAPLTVTAADASKTYDGQAWAEGAGVVFNGFVAGEDASVLGGSLAYSGDSQGAVDAGTYTIAAGGFASNNYSISFVDGTLTVDPASLTILTQSASKIYDSVAWSGGAGVTYEGFVPGDDATSLDGSLSFIGASQGAIDVGEYDLVATGLFSNNYVIDVVGASLTIDQAPLSVTANHLQKTYDGTGFSGGNGVTYEGFVGAEDASYLGGSLVFLGDSQGAQDTGSYTITPTGLLSTNYAITYASGTLVIDPATLVITADNITQKFRKNQPFEGATASYDGFVADEDPGVLDGALVFGGVSQGATDKGTYTIIASGLSSSNYDINYVDGVLTLTAGKAVAPGLQEGPREKNPIAEEASNKNEKGPKADKGEGNGAEKGKKKDDR